MGKKRRDSIVILRFEEAVTLGLLGEVGLGPGGGEEGGGHRELCTSSAVSTSV